MSIGLSARFGVVLGVFTAALLVAGVATSQNLAANGDFDLDTDGWAGDTSPSYLAEDWQEEPGSGSLRLVNDAVTESSIQVGQCVPLGGTDPVVFEGALRSSLSPETSGRIRIVVAWHNAGGCEPLSTIFPLEFPLTLDAPQDWTLVTSAPISPPVGAVAADVQLTATKTSAVGSLTTDFDAIYVPEPTAASAGAIGAFTLLALRRRHRNATGRAAPLGDCPKTAS